MVTYKCPKLEIWPNILLVDTPFHMLFFFPFVTENDMKTPKRIISTSKQQAKHLFAGQNTQHLTKPI